ncbi:MAG: helix-turn-helix domain-containing protein, partial [Bacteroidota bacterium]
NIEFRFFSRETSLPTWFDPHLLDKALLNLLTNAFECTQTDGTGKIDMVVIKDLIANQAIIKVEDNGKGMSKEQAETAFDKNPSAASTSKGAGLGLFLTKELVNLHGGGIGLWSEKGKGSRFEISLPLGKEHLRPEQISKGKTGQVSQREAAVFVEEEAPALLAQAAPAAILAKEKEPTLLLIEQDDELRQFLKKHFGKTYNLREAAEGNAALQLAFEEQPDLILADLAEPGKGLALTKTLKSDLRTSHIPVILLANQNAIEQKIEGIQTGADAFVTKPFNLVFLSEIVKNLLRGRESLRERYASPLPPGKMRSGVGNLDQQFLSQFTRFVEANFADPNLTVQHVGDEFGLSRTQLFRKVKALLGESVNDYIQQVRMKKACHLLLEGKLTVSEIAYKVGYSSPAYFATAFKALHACSPSEFKEKNGGSSVVRG